MILRAVPRLPISLDTSELDRDFAIASSKVEVRRHWIIRTFLALTLSSMVLVLLVVLRADHAAIQSILKSLDRRATALQAEVDQLGQLPATLPGIDQLKMAYANGLVREYAKSTGRPVIAASTSLAQPVIRSGGRGVIIYEDGQVRCEWFTSQDFEAASKAQTAAITTWDEQRRQSSPDLP